MDIHTHTPGDNPSRDADAKGCPHPLELCCRDCCDRTIMSAAGMAAIAARMGVSVEYFRAGIDELIAGGFLRHLHGDVYQRRIPQ